MNKEINGYDVICGETKVGELRNGANGKNGSNGESCTVVVNKEINGYDVICGETKVGELRNGANGKNGENGKDAEILSQACQTLRSTTDKFNSLYDVFYCLRSYEKVAFILRHAARNSNQHGQYDPLNDAGVAQSKKVGEKLKAMNLDNFYYMHTNVRRTAQTAMLISQSKGEETGSENDWYNYAQKDFHEENNNLLDSWYIKNSDYKKDCQAKNNSGWAAYSKMAYLEFEDNDVKSACEKAFYYIDPKTKELYTEQFSYKNLQHKYTLAISHDQFLVPFVVSISNKQIKGTNQDLRFHKFQDNKHWLNYLSGVAIITDGSTIEIDGEKKENFTIIPVTALESGFLE